MRGLVIVTVVMGVMIVAGTVGLMAVIVHRLGGAVSSARPLVLDEPAGTRIAGLAGTADRLAIRLEGGGPDRIVLIDPRDGAVLGRIALSQ